MPKKEDHPKLSKGVHNRCTRAWSVCVELEARCDGFPAALARTFSPFLGGCEPAFDIRPLALLLIHAVRLSIVRLLAAETLLREIEAGLAPARRRRDLAAATLYRRLRAFRFLAVWDNGPVVPPGRTPREPKRLLELAAVIRPRLDSPDLQLEPGKSFGVRMLPGQGKWLDEDTSALAAALARIEEILQDSRETRAARNAAANDLDAYVAVAESVLRTVDDLRALDPGEGS